MIWHTEGLFSTHYLEDRLPSSGHWPSADESDAAFEVARRLLAKNERGLRSGDEEECEKRFVTPLLDALGYGHTNRKAIPDAADRRLPDYLLYANPADAEVAFQTGAHYTQCIGLLEAKRWGRNLSEESSGKGTAPRGRSPHYQIRDYLTETAGIEWGILTNGKEWRLYCKKDRASAYFAFDLKQVLANEDEAKARAEFRFFHALFRREAFERTPDGTCILDRIRDGVQRFKEEVERDLRAQVFDCVEALALGFLQTEGNDLSEADLPEIYDHCLILLYRILFVLNAEARALLPTDRANERSRKYYDSYGLQLIRDKLATQQTAPEYADDGTYQLYSRLQALFNLINGKPAGEGRKDKNEELGIPRYNGGLFDPARYPFLEAKRVADSHLSRVLTGLSFRIEAGGALTAFDYANLGERHLGSVYEGLLEHHLLMVNGQPALINNKGERKTSGAYYTPQEIVTYIVENTLEPLLPAVEAAEGILDDSFGIQTLGMKVCDPAMGSAHFLVEAVTFLADRIAAHATTAPRPALNNNGEPRLKNDGSQEPLLTQEAKLAYWRRRVVESCIYGVDLNPLAVELAKLSLWLKTVDRVPLNFLDHHLRRGDSLLGTDLQSLSGLPKVNGSGNGNGNGGQLSFGFSAALEDALAGAIADIHAIESVPTDTHDAAKRKEALWRDVTTNRMPWFRQVGDLWMARWFGVDLKLIPYIKATDSREHAAELRANYASTLDPLCCFHWELEFPDVFFNDDGTPKANPGFDAVVTNPPWERIKLQENEFFAGRSAEIAMSPRAADRRLLIADLPQTDPGLWASYGGARDRADNTIRFAQKSGFFPLMGRGDTNFYALFAEKALKLIHRRGRIGILTPSGIAMDDTTKGYFQKIVGERRLKELLDFENRKVFFPDVDSRFKFSISLITGEELPAETARCAFFLHDVAEVKDPDRAFTLTAEDFALFNPNTRTCPIFRRRRDMELTRKIYENAPVLVNEAAGEEGNPWGITFSTMFHMTNDSKYFRTAKELEKDGYWLAAENVFNKAKSHYVPLYEAKMIHQYDHRYAAGVTSEIRLQSTQASAVTEVGRKVDPAYYPKPRYWVPAERVGDGLPFRLGFRDIARSTDIRTCIAAIIPPDGVGNKFPLIRTTHSAALDACLLANLNSILLDYAARQKVVSTSLNFFIVEQFPILPPARYTETWRGVYLEAFIGERVLELSYTAHDLKGFAGALGFTGPPFTWDDERRLHLRCQLDALYFHLYGLTRDEATEILGTFPIVKRQDEARYGRYRTAEMIVSYYNAYDCGDMDAWVAA